MHHSRILITILSFLQLLYNMLGLQWSPLRTLMMILDLYTVELVFSISTAVNILVRHILAKM